jgi:hypothetical protein
MYEMAVSNSATAVGRIKIMAKVLITKIYSLNKI